MGAPLATFLGLVPGDPVALVLTDPGPDGVHPRLLRFQLAGLFEVGAELDYGLVIIAREALAASDQAAFGRTGVRITLADPLDAPVWVQQARAAVPELAASSWADTYGELWLVPAYTGKPRKEITPEHAATVMRVLSVFPGSHVVAFEKTPNHERPERPEKRS